MGDDHSENDSSDSGYVPASESESDSDSDNSDSDNSENNDDSDSNVEETPEDIERTVDILDEEEAGDDIPTEPSQ